MLIKNKDRKVEPQINCHKVEIAEVTPILSFQNCIGGNLSKKHFFSPSSHTKIVATPIFTENGELPLF